MPFKSQPFACKNLAGNGCFCDTSKAMSVVIELDENLVAEIDAVANNSNKNRLQYINETLRKALREDSGKRKYTSEEVREMYRKAYGKKPQTAEEIEEWEEVQHWEDE